MITGTIRLKEDLECKGSIIVFERDLIGAKWFKATEIAQWNYP